MSTSSPGCRRSSVAAYPWPESVPPIDTCCARVAAWLPSRTRIRLIAGQSSVGLERADISLVKQHGGIEEDPVAYVIYLCFQHVSVADGALVPHRPDLALLRPQQNV